MRGLKLPGERIMARDFDRQEAEVQIRIGSQVLPDQWRSPAPHEPLHITRHARDCPHALTQAGKGTRSAAIQIAQQSHSAAALIGAYAFWPQISESAPIWIIAVAIGGLAGAVLGSRFLSDKWLRAILALLLAGSGLKLIW